MMIYKKASEEEVKKILGRDKKKVLELLDDNKEKEYRLNEIGFYGISIVDRIGEVNIVYVKQSKRGNGYAKEMTIDASLELLWRDDIDSVLYNVSNPFMNNFIRQICGNTIGKNDYGETIYELKKPKGLFK